jgi:hypothetical protein
MACSAFVALKKEKKTKKINFYLKIYLFMNSHILILLYHVIIRLLKNKSSVYKEL